MIHLFTTKYGYHERPDLWKYLRLSAAKCGVEFHGYGGTSVVPCYYKMRILDMIAYLESIDASHVLYCDSRDSLMVYHDAPKAIGILENYGKPLVFQAERNCFPYPDLATRYPVHSSPWKYLNGGGFFGERSFVLQKLRELKKIHEGLETPDESASDQGMWSVNYVDTQSFALDYECRLFQSLYLNHPDDLSVVDGLVKNKYHPESEPQILHWNGNWPGIREMYKAVHSV